MWPIRATTFPRNAVPETAANEPTPEPQAYPNQSIFERDDFTCRYCGTGGRGSFEQWFTAHLGVDHVKPRKHGGSDEAENLVTCCHACNVYKGSADCDSFEEALAYVEERRDIARKWYEKHVVSEASAT